MSYASRALGAALTFGIALTATACGSATPAPQSAGNPVSSAPSVEPTPEGPTTPQVAEPTVAPLDIDPSTSYQVGPEGAEAAYREIVDLATLQALDPDFFFRDGDNSGADLAEVSTRLTPNQAQYLREQADLCADPADTSNACNNVVGIAFFDFGTEAVPATYRDDMEFVTEQSITNPRMTGVIPDLGTSYLELTLDHTIHVRFLHNGTPASWTVTRHLTYHLVPSTGGSGTSWQIDNWRIEPTQDDLRDEATGQPIDG